MFDSARAPEHASDLAMLNQSLGSLQCLELGKERVQQRSPEQSSWGKEKKDVRFQKTSKERVSG